MYNTLRPYLFRLDPERAHELTLRALRIAGNFSPARKTLELIFAAPQKPVEAFGLKFKNPVGLAAGYDKDGVALRGLSALGFGHLEIGTVTPRPQAGNPSPRVFRLVEDEAVINRMGFPSRGSERALMELDSTLRASIVERILGFDPRPRVFTRFSDSILGVNLGKNKETPNEQAALDYVSLVDVFSRYADYLTINISSPNTAGLRQLQERDALENLLKHIHAQRVLNEARHEKKLPILIKLSPDLSEAELDDAIEVILRAKMDGVIVTNTTLSRDGLRSNLKGESGGLSGSPLRARSEAVLHQTVKRVNGQIPIVSAGGIMHPDDAKKRLDMGATLIQVYTGLIYRGPALVKQILQGLKF
ncbi:MAG: quinone-dependent dihydroorotate dehydrogenase [Anaerolineales bacterium]|nr:quinone-dependent dihydroorotate dehydrogenase [Anaerolineales bacterium]